MNNIVLLDTDYPGSFHTSGTAMSMGPLGIQYIASYLNKNGKKVTVLEQNGKSLDIFSREVLKYNPELVGFSNMLVKWNDQNKLADMLKKINEIYTVIGGPGISGYPDLLTNSNFDYGLKGEGEEALLSLINALEGKCNLSLICVFFICVCFICVCFIFVCLICVCFICVFFICVFFIF